MAEQAEYLSLALKARRKQLALSLDQTAKRTGVSKAMLGQIERGESSPTIATLWKIATGLEISLSALISETPDHTDTVKTVCRDPDQLRRPPTEEGLCVATLFPYEEQFGFEYFELTLLAGRERLSEPHEKNVVEFVTLLQGEMDVLSDGIWHVLKIGQSIRFPGDAEHGYRNRGQEKAVFHCIIHYPHTFRKTERGEGP